MTKKCLQCGVEVPQTDGRKARLFCSANHRNKYYYAQKTAGKEPKKRGRKPVSEITQNHNSPINPAPDNTKEEVVVITLDKLREMCPPELTGIDRTMWIQEQRKKYGI